MSLKRDELDELRLREVEALEGLAWGVRALVPAREVPVVRPGLRAPWHVSRAVGAGVLMRAVPGLAERFRAIPAEHLSHEGVSCPCGALTAFSGALLTDCSGGCGRYFAGTPRGAWSAGPFEDGWRCACGCTVNAEDEAACFACGAGRVPEAA